MSVGLVLAGGGAKGSYQAEVARHIMREKDVSVICGVSAGALNGCMLAQEKPNHLFNIWKGARRKDVWRGGIWNWLEALLGRSRGIYDPEPLQELINQNFNPNDVDVPFKAGAVCLDGGEYTEYEIRPERSYTDSEKQKARKFVVASSAVPGAVKPVDVDGKYFADGGVRQIAPIGQAIDEGATHVIAIFNSRLKDPWSEPATGTALEVAKWAVETALNDALRHDLRTARLVNEMAGPKYKDVEIDVIEPSAPIGEASDFSIGAWRQRVKIGKKDATTYLNG